MSNLDFALGRLERIGDFCNAIVVKEVRQSLKSRQFVGTFLLLLMVAWGGSIFGVSMSGDSIEYGSSAEGFFVLFFLILCVACLVIVPYAAFRSIVEERSENTLELVQITALAPRQIVWGKSLSALVQVLVYFSAIAPFVAFTALLPGFDFVHTAFGLGALLVASVSFSSIALAIGAQTRNKISQAFGSLGVIVLAFIGMIIFAQLGFAMGTFIPLGDATVWWGIAIAVFAALSTAFLFQQVAIAQLTFESDNRSSGIRLTVTVQWLIGWLAILGFAAFFGHTPSGMDVYALVLLTTVFLTIAALHVTSESEGLSRRVARGLPRSRLMRAVWAPFLPGGTRGLLFGLASLGLMTMIAVVATAIDTKTGLHFTRTSKEVSSASVVLGYAVIYLGAGAFLTRLFRRVLPGFSPGHLFAILLLINLVLIVIEMLCHFLLNIRDNTLMPFDLVNPVITVDAIHSSRSGSETAVVGVAAGALLALVINWRALSRAIREVLQNPVRTEIEREAARRLQAQAALAEGAVLEVGVPSS